MTSDAIAPGESIEVFLAYAIELEQQAALRFAELADAMQASGNRECSALFRRLAEYSRRHLADARERAGFRQLPRLRPDQFAWPGMESPEAAAIWAADPLIGRGQALEVALDAERAGLDFYSELSTAASDPEVRERAGEFACEEAEHVAELERWLELHRQGSPLPRADPTSVEVSR